MSLIMHTFVYHMKISWQNFNSYGRIWNSFDRISNLCIAVIKKNIKFGQQNLDKIHNSFDKT